MGSIVTGIGGYLPERILTNAELEPMVDTSDAWIVERTGIRQRHISAPAQRTSDLGTQAALAALKAAGCTPGDIDLVICATSTPDETMPSTAARIQARLGITRGAAFDINAACSGFVYALTLADSLLKSGSATRALIVGAETYSRIVDWKDRSTCILFGDGAGAMVLEAGGEGRGVLGTHIRADGKHGDILATTGGVCATQTAGTIFMQGKDVFRHAVAKMSECVSDACAALKLPLSGVDWLVPHQANWRILASVAQKLGIPEEKVISTVALHANTSSASIPLALAAGVADGRIRPGNIVALAALGAGLTWGSCIIKW